MQLQIINYSLTEIVICFIVVGYAAVDLVPCDKTRRVFHSSWGVISDGPVGSNYTQDSHCEWLIKANNTNKFITLIFRSMGTECSYDYVFVYDGDSFNSPLLGSFSGKTEPQQVIATSGYMLVLLYSDTNYVLDGFKAEFSITDCPNNCTDHGVCYENRCICESDWGGSDCSRPLCPDNCGRQQRRGHCSQGLCKCRSGYSGQACSLYEHDAVGNKWHWMSHSEGGFQPRAAHSAVYIEMMDSLYVFGGYNLNTVLGNLEIYNFQTSNWRNENGEVLLDKNLLSSIDPSSVAKLFEHAGRDWEQKWGVNSRTSFLRNLLYTVTNNVTYTRRRQRHSKINGHEPAPRYGHAACAVSKGFVLFGGKLYNGSLSNDLWYYDVQTRIWQLRAQFSQFQPPQLTRHTLTCVNDVIYLFGGSTVDGEFSSALYSIKLSNELDESWQEIKPRGGKQLDVRVVAHSMVYHSSTNSLIIYGGIIAGVARFSKLSDKMFAFQLDNRYWTEIHYTREYLREKFVPRERAFHTANIFGNYLVIFGGYSHRHNKEEICYDNQMYLYHLGCHTWVNPDILGKSTESIYPKQQGVFAHAASVRNDNTLLIVGGYHGNVNGDLLAYTVPPMIAVRKGEIYDPELACTKHHNYGECSADPECGWCSADEQCYGRTIGANCTTNLQSTRCPGICPALGDCHSCLIHGHISSKHSPVVSAAHKLGLQECNWCVQNAKCHHKDDNYGVCGLQEDSPSQIPGWWGPKGTEVVNPAQCREFDRRPGLTFIKYYHPVNFSQPDNVAVINATTVDFNSPTSFILREFTNGEMVARLLGFLRLPSSWQEMLNICISYCSATLTISDRLIANVTAEQKDCKAVKWVENMTSDRIAVDFKSKKVINMGAHNSPFQQSKMELQHYKQLIDPPKAFTFEYLEPYANGSCDQYKNCLHCLTDSQCGWCELTNSCQSRLKNENISCTLNDNWQYLTLQPSSCSNCSNYITCDSCINTNLCEWWIEEARCARIGQRADAAVAMDQCPMPCYKRSTCGSCLDQKGRCVWCQATQQCFSFSVYTSEYQFGLCREWLDQAFPLVTRQENGLLPASKTKEQCKTCSMHYNCSTCLSSLSCGWCYHYSNPMSGVCVQGDFNNPHVQCSDLLNSTEVRWAYAQCPDVDECGLGLHDCHPQAICTNTDGSFSCHCKQGYIGDGKSSCVRTCFNICVHGVCKGEPDYACKCDVGWYGDDCSKNCGCNNHSICPEGKGICKDCLDNTMGEFCQFCRPGSFGNATTEEGCQKCDCNGHGNTDKGECDIESGICYCEDNTQGNHCERCKDNYFGDPRNGKQCYYQCEARGFLEDPKGQGISSIQTYSPPWGGPPTRECLWIIKPNVASPIIQLQVNLSQLNVTCGENAVYVYDGVPELGNSGNQNSLSGVFCREEALPTAVVESRTGQLTVHYKQGLQGESFSAIYKVISCDKCDPPRECRNGQCVCQDGAVGFDCEEIICPKNCSYAEGHGTCDKSYGRCLCMSGWTGTSCDIRITDSQIIFTELFNTQKLSDSLDHFRKTLPRFGHSLVSDRRGLLWMFGGYSLSHGPLNDIRLFDTRNLTWMQVTIESTPDATMPVGRYFHGADMVHSRQAIFVYGGLTKKIKDSNNRTLDEFWQFDIQNQRWGQIEKSFGSFKWPPPLAGHTLTYYRNSTYESLIIIGGVSPQGGFLNTVWEYKLDKEHWQPLELKGQGPFGIFGHSTIYHASSNNFFVFGGIIVEHSKSRKSNSLFMFSYDTKTWTELNSLGSSVFTPPPRFFHSAVTTEHYMIIFGGKIFPWNTSNTLYAYSYSCNQWINLMSEAIEKVGTIPIQTYAQAMTIEPDGDAAYIIGGWGIDTQSTVTRLELPLDLCNLWPKRFNCLRVPGCGYCSNKIGDDIVSEVCHTNTDDCPLETLTNSSRVTNQGKICTLFTMLFSNCSMVQDCSTCMRTKYCTWCQGKCVSNNLTCTSPLLNCSYNRCTATDCVQCHQIPRCNWSYPEGECVEVLEPQEVNSVSVCPRPCINYSTCTSCLEATDCRWSTKLNECISASYQSIYCAGGVCGLVLQSDERQYCPEPCNSFSQCSTCLTHAHCGWCSTPALNGQGKCIEGSNERPLLETCSNSFDEIDETSLEDENTSLTTNLSSAWNYVQCPPENECSNGHHTCDVISEICVDLDKGFKCVCGPGYKSGPNGCEPVCRLGCVRGHCVQPNKCQCDFGYVGANCSIQCQCNGHANCEGPDKLDKCLQCFNNTMGAQCEKCMPLFVGDPSDGGNCVPCLEYCHGHTSICVDNSTDLDPDDYIDDDFIQETIKEGPKANARCLRCANFTSGPRCNDCITGNFRGSEDHRDSCRPCDCHGHGDNCDPVYGDKCNCQNNTESDVCRVGSEKNSAHPCWMVQCSKCKEGYLGTPTSGHQCYKQMSVDSKMCFDAKPIDECKMKPKPLYPGEVVFFVIQPRFMNVDIRIIIDVTQGKLNVFMSTHDDTYIAFSNSSTGSVNVDIDGQYGHWENGTLLSKDVYLEREALGLRTYITITQPKTILLVKNLQDRLVITLPEEYHSLETTRFFLVLQALDQPESDKKVAYGIVFSRQDQLHIDLFVFFSVFFSCFFLFLAACVVTWKAKQAADVRRARRRHVVEMQHMAKRPFASVTLNLSTKVKPKKSMHYDVRPVAVEPTGDGLAGVATVFVSLPGGKSAPVKLSLGSSLILLARQLPTGGRIFLRRRSIHAAPPT